MSSVKEITPKVEGRETREMGRALSPFARSLEDFMESIFPGRFMEPLSLRRSLFPEMEMSLEAFWPRMDVIDLDKELKVRAELPGVKKDDLELILTEDSLRLRARTESKEVKKDQSFYRCETHQGSFERYINLPVEVDSEHAKAKLEDGILEVTLPKRKAAKRHTVKIS